MDVSGYMQDSPERQKVDVDSILNAQKIKDGKNIKIAVFLHIERGNKNGRIKKNNKRE